MNNKERYDKLWYSKLLEQIINDYNMYKKIDYVTYKTTLSKLQKHVLVQIKNNTFNIITHKNKNNRYKSIKILLEIMFSWIHKNNKDINCINGIFAFRITDGYDFEYNIPTICFSKPFNKKSFLYPDFNIYKLDEKKEMFKKNCNNINKKNEIYFKGSSSSIEKSYIREYMEKFKTPFNIDISKEYLPYYDICNYKYLLDLPGVKPWSVRLIELYLSKSFPIRVIMYYNKWDEKRWVQFYEKMFDNSYISVEYDTNYNKKLSLDTINTIRNDILDIYKQLEDNKELYIKTVNRNYEKAISLTQDHISFYMYNLFKYYNKLIIRS